MNNHDTDVRGDSADALLTAPTEIVVSGQRLTLDSHLWRDFQRGAPATGRPLNAALDVQALDADAFPPGWHAQRAWFIKQDETWTAELTAQPAPAFERGAHLTLGARGGPHWEPGAEVSTIVLLRGPGGSERYLRAENRAIQRID